MSALLRIAVGWLFGVNKVWGIIAMVPLLLYNSGMWLYNKHRSEVVYHAWAAMEHRFEEVKVIDNDSIQVYWTQFPLIPNTSFLEEWHLKIPGRGWIPIESWHYKKDAVPPYRVSADHRDVKDVGFWGKEVDLSGYNLETGTYEIKVCYHYDDFNWLVNDWCANQEIVFRVE